MADNDKMPNVKDGTGKNRKLTIVEQEFMQFIEKKNQARVADLQRIRKNNRITGFLLGAGVLGIYGYSMYAIHQENFLDDFDEPAKTSD